MLSAPAYPGCLSHVRRDEGAADDGTTIECVGVLRSSQSGSWNSVSPASRQSRAASRISGTWCEGVAPQPRAQFIVILAPRPSSMGAGMATMGCMPLRSEALTPANRYSLSGSIQNSPDDSGSSRPVRRRRIPRHRTWAMGCRQAGQSTATEGRWQHGHTEGPRPACGRPVPFIVWSMILSGDLASGRPER